MIYLVIANIFAKFSQQLQCIEYIEKLKLKLYNTQDPVMNNILHKGNFYTWPYISSFVLNVQWKGTVTFYTVLCPEHGSNFVVCAHCTCTFRSRYKQNNSFYNIKYHFIRSWWYNPAAVSRKVRWVFYEKYGSYTRIRNSGRAFWNMQKYIKSTKTHQNG